MCITIKWWTTACFQIKTDDVSIFIDPGYYKRSYHNEFENLSQKADIILITHAHADHLMLDIIKKLRKSDTEIFGPAPCLKKIKEGLNIVEPEKEYISKGVKFKTIHSYNISNSKKPAHIKGNGVGYLLSIDNKTIYHSGDSDFIPEMKHLGQVTVALLPLIGGRFSMDIHEVVNAVNYFKPKYIIPMHPLKNSIKDFSEVFEKEKSGDYTEAVILKETESFELN